MKFKPTHLRRDRGVALVLVLSFVVLLTGLILALLSRSLSSGLISSASLDNTRSDIYAHGAADQVIADLRQEITDGSVVAGASGSISSPFQPAGAANSIYRPTLPGNAEPYNSGPASYTTTTWNTTFPNLVKESSAGAPLYQSTPTATYANPGISRAAPVSTTTTGGYINSGSASGASRNNRYISPATWNQALLLPKQTPASTADLTPSQGFIAPDWILSAVDGTNPGGTGSGDTPFDSGNDKTTSNVNPQSPKYVTGRYAYTIYNEGGLLDANVAGSPGPGTTSGNLGTGSSVNGPSQQVIWSRKGPEAFADLTQIPGMTQKDVDQLVGWRNYATLGGSNPSGFPSLPSLTGTAVDDYFGYLLGISSRFMTTGNDPTGQVTDRRFTSRQQMISFFQDIYDATDTADRSTMQNDMMYFTNFSRTLNQPSYWPDPKRPRVLASSGSSASGLDDKVNPPFKSIVVKTSFTRADGTTAVVGEPLVKKRFALSRLIWLTYKGPSASLSTGDPLYQQYLKLMPQAQLQQLWNEGNKQNIQNYFGLTFQGTVGQVGGSWVYSPPGAGTGGIASQSIATLDQLVATREPNFFELLQAAINVGSLGSSQQTISTGATPGDGNMVTIEQEKVDKLTYYQVLQIGANIIDQASPDDYPTNILFNDGATPPAPTPHSFWGVKDLPYLGGIGQITVESVAGSATPNTNFDNAFDTQPLSGKINLGGQGVLLQTPILWNPYTYNPNSNPPSTLYPSTLRVDALKCTSYFPTTSTTQNMQMDPQGINWDTGQKYGATMSDAQAPIPPDPWPIGMVNPQGWVTEISGSFSNALQFNNTPSATLFREPTPLLTTAQATAPAGGNLQSNVGRTSITNVGGTDQIVGFFLGASQVFVNPQTPIPTTPQYYVINYYQPLSSAQFGVTYSLEYQVGSGSTSTWIPYQQYPMTTNFLNLKAQYNGDDVPNNLYTQTILERFKDGLLDQSMNMTYDPRTVRWGTSKDDDMQPFLSGSSTMTGTERPTASSAMQGQHENIGLASQNLPGANANTDYTTADADGVIRRAMGAYVPTNSAIGLPMATVFNTPGNTYNRPIILHRPFRSVAELGYTFRDTPWKNLDFFTPESGDAALLDTFCINEDERPDAVAAGQVDLNTRQVAVLEALLAGTYRDEITSTDLLSTQEAKAVALTLLQRTESTAVNKGPLENIADLVGRYVNGFTSSAPNDNQPYDGFSSDLSIYRPSVSTSAEANSIQRLREVTMRALSDAGQAGTWNLMIDLVAQTGRYPANASSLADFLVQGQRHYWIHVAIDRTTGKIIDENIEPVNE